MAEQVKGVIGIKDNMSGVLRQINKEQGRLRKAVSDTGKVLKSTFDKQIKAKVETNGAVRQVKALSDKIRPMGHEIKKLGNMVAEPVVRIKDGVSKGLSVVGGKIKSLAKTIAIPVTIATGAVVGGAISEGAKLEQSIGGVETLFKGDAGAVKANADKAFKTAGLSANEYMETVTSFSASLLNSLGGNTAKAAKVSDMAMIDMSDNANKFGTDMGSIQNAYQGFAKQNYTMLDNLKLGYGGTQKEMARLLADATKITGVKYDMSNLSDVYSAIHAVQKKLGVTGTTAKEATKTFSGSFAAMKASAQNLLGNMAIGGDVEKSMGQLVDSAFTFLIGNAIPMIGRVLSALPGAISTGIAKAGPKINKAGGDIMKGLYDGMISIFPESKSIIDKVTSTFSELSTVATPVIKSVFNTVVNIIKSAAPVIGGVVNVVSGAVKTALPVIGDIINGIGEKVGVVLDILNENMPFIQSIFDTVVPAITQILSSAWSVISPIIDGVILVFKTLVSVVKFCWPAISSVINIAVGIVTTVLNTGGAAIKIAVDLVTGVFNGLGSAVSTVFNGIKSVIETVWNTIAPIIKKITEAVDTVSDAPSHINVDSGYDGMEYPVGSNASGTNNWRGGVTWVGEKGPELIDLPRGTRILPNKESVSLAASANKPLYSVPKYPASNGKSISQSIKISLEKLADKIIIREDADIDRIGKAVAREIVLAYENMA